MDEQRDTHEELWEETSVYANNAQFETSAWDLKIRFGQLDQSGDTPRIDWQVGVTMPWTQAKVCAYYLMANLALYEQANGSLRVPGTVIPPYPTELPDENDTPENRALLNILRRYHEQLFGKMPQPGS